MGFLGNLFLNLFTTIWNGITWIGETIGGFFSWLGRLIWQAVEWVGGLLVDLFTSLFNLLLSFFTFIFDLIGVFGYFLYQIGLLAAKIFMIFFELLKLIYSFFVGLGQTLASLTYTPQGSGGHGYSQMIGQVFSYADSSLQLNVIAYILLFAIWIFTAIQVIHLLSTIRGSGD